MNIIIDNIIKILNKKNYKIYTNGTYNINIVGIRTSNSIPNKFDDYLFVFYKREDDKWSSHLWNITTDPGLPWLLKPLSKKGTAVLKEGQYVSTYKIDKHQGKYDALCQRLKPVTVYRDGNKNGILDLNEDSLETGMFGINIHKSSWFSTIINKHSAGCQVFQSSKDFEEFMKLCSKAAKIYGNKFTYTLILESDFDS